MNQIERIKNMGYKIREDKDSTPFRDCNGTKIYHLYAVSPFNDNRETHIYIGDKYMYFLGENKVDNIEEAEDLIKRDKGIKIKGCEFYRQFYNLNNEEYCLFRHGYDLEVKNFLDTVKNKIGLLRYTSDANSSKTPEGEFTQAPDDCKSMTVFWNSSDVVYWQLDNGEWIAQYGFLIAIDDYAVTKFYFREEPTDLKCRIAYAISQVELKFSIKNKKEAEECLDNLKKFLEKEGV